jgi:uncharacterized protein (TIGR03435 family)
LLRQSFIRALLLICVAAVTAFSQSTETNLRFEVASVKRSDPKRGGLGKRFSCDSKHCSAEGIPLAGLAFDAYGLKESYQFEAATSLSSEHYDIEATVPDGTTIEQAHVMLQRLLAERFELVVHRETRQLPGFRLVVAKGGPKLTKAVDVPASAGPDIVKKDGIPQYSNSAKSGVLFTIEAEIIHGRDETMSGFVHQLVQAIREPVIDATGIEGEYDYDLSFESIVKPQAKGVVYQGLQPTPQAGPALPTDPAGSDHPTIFAVIKQQLGLQLDAAKSISVEVVVLDKANREPTEN